MDPISNPYSPGAGSPPPQLAGRDDIIEKVRIALERIRRGRAAKSILMVGLRGVGKTVLLDHLKKKADAAGFLTTRAEAPEDRSLPALLAPQLRGVLLKLSKKETVKELAKRGLQALAGFARALKMKYEDIEVAFDFEPEPGLADNGDLEMDLQQLIELIGVAAREADTGVVLFLDELQYVETDQLAALITALHRASQLQLPVTLVGAGLPQLRGRMGKAKSYAERLFDFPEIGALDEESARDAIINPAHNENVEYEQQAVNKIIQVTKGYPYFIQEWGKHVWDIADESPIELADVHSASDIAVAALDVSFFLVRFDRLTPKEKDYLRAMSELGPGPHRSGDIAELLDRKVESVAPLRNGLIGKGMIWSPHHGDTAFTVPLFDKFMKRIMPSDDWKG